MSDVYVKMIRFCWNKSIWNDVKSLTGATSNNFFSRGLIEVNRTISRSPVFVNIAKAIVTKNITKLLLDNTSAFMPLNEKTAISAEKVYEFVFEITGRFRDDDKSTVLGRYYGKLFHEQIQANEKSARQDIFNWKEFYKTSYRKEKELRTTREKELGFSFPPEKA